MKKSYRLTPEEEALLQEKPVEEGGMPNSLEPGQASDRRKNTWGGVIALAGALVLMIGIAYVFFGLLTGPGTEETTGVPLPSNSFSAQERAEIDTRLALTSEEATLFWPIFQRFREEITTLRRQHLENLKDWESQEVAGFDPEALGDAYMSYTEEYRSIVSRYVQAFSVAVAPDKIPEILLISEEMDGKK